MEKVYTLKINTFNGHCCITKSSPPSRAAKLQVQNCLWARRKSLSERPSWKVYLEIIS